MQVFTQFNRLVFGKIVLSISNFSILLLLSNFYPYNVTGSFYYQITLISTFAVFLSFGTDNSLFFFVKKNMISLRNLVALGYRSLGIFIIIALSFFVLYYLKLCDNISGIICSCAFIWSCLMQNVFNAWLSGNRQGWKLQLLFILSNIIFLCYLVNEIYAGYSVNHGALVYIFYTINFLVSVIALVIMHYKTGLFKVFPPQPALLKKVLRFGMLPYISSSLFFLGANIDLFFIKSMRNSSLTVYVQAIKLFQMICSVAYLLYYPFMGKIITSSYRDGIDALLKAGRIIINGLLILLFPFYFLCYFFLDKIFPVDSIKIFSLLLILSIAIIATGAAYLYTSYFIAMKRYRQNFISALIFVATVTICCFFLVPWIGIYGGALAYSAAILCSLIFDMMYVVGSVNASITDTFLLKKDDIKFIKSIF